MQFRVWSRRPPRIGREDDLLRRQPSVRPMPRPPPADVTDIGWFPHQVTRLVFDTGQPYEEFRARYQAKRNCATAT